jgi:hypothetical protein
MKENLIRSIELGVVLSAGYMGAITTIQTTLYEKILDKIKASFIGELLKNYVTYFDLAFISLVIITVFYLWRKGDSASFARIFNINMLLFFSAVLDFSSFNWIGLIFNLTPSFEVSAYWVFGVGLLLQMAYLFLRYTVRFRYTRDELLGRGASPDDIDQVSRGQMGYLTMLVLVTTGLTVGIFLTIPYIDNAIRPALRGLKNQHLLIGFIVVMSISATLIFYLRGAISEKEISEKPTGEEPVPSTEV